MVLVWPSCSRCAGTFRAHAPHQERACTRAWTGSQPTSPRAQHEPHNNTGMVQPSFFLTARLGSLQLGHVRSGITRPDEQPLFLCTESYQHTLRRHRSECVQMTSYDSVALTLLRVRVLSAILVDTMDMGHSTQALLYASHIIPPDSCKHIIASYRRVSGLVPHVLQVAV